MKKTDIILLCSALAAAAVIFAICLAFAGGGAYALVTVDGEEYARLPLDEDTELTVSTELGENVVVVENGQIYVKHADCPNKDCVKSGVATPALPVICSPHKLVITIEE